VDAHDGVRVVDLTREHPLELRRAHPRHEGGYQRFGLGDGLVVLLRRAEIEQHLRVVDVAPQLLE
jgi:hypothetical protein